MIMDGKEVVEGLNNMDDASVLEKTTKNTRERMKEDDYIPKAKALGWKAELDALRREKLKNEIAAVKNEIIEKVESNKSRFDLKDKMIILNATLIDGVDYSDLNNFKIKKLSQSGEYGFGPDFYGGIVNYVAEIQDKPFLILMNDFDGLKVIDVMVRSISDISIMWLRKLAKQKLPKNTDITFEEDTSKDDILQILIEKCLVLTFENKFDKKENTTIIDLRKDPSYALPMVNVVK
jgi:hypothetical protein